MLDIWADMNYENDLSRNDIAYLQRVCEPNISIHKGETSQGTLAIQEMMDPNEIMLIRVHYEY